MRDQRFARFFVAFFGVPELGDLLAPALPPFFFFFFFFGGSSDAGLLSSSSVYIDFASLEAEASEAFASFPSLEGFASFDSEGFASDFASEDSFFGAGGVSA